MDQAIQEDISGGPSGLPSKRRRGRPRKHPSLRHAKAARPTPGFGGVKEHQPQRADSSAGIDYMVGQTVTGVVEATFDAGYLLSVRIGDSNTNLRGVVFKPGHYVPVTAENDVAPHVQMIRRNDVHLPAKNRGSTHGQKRAAQTSAMVPLKRKYGPPKTAPSVPPVGVRGNVVPVVLQPVQRANGIPTSNQLTPNASQTAHVLDFGDKDVHMVEPISMLPPDRSIPAGQIFATTQLHSSHQVTQCSQQNEDVAFSVGASDVGQGDKAKTMTSTDVDTSGSSQTSDVKIDNGKEALKSSEDAGIVSKCESGNFSEPPSTDPLQTASLATPLFSYGTGRMTELLQAVQENMKENQVHRAAQQTSMPQVEIHETEVAEDDSKNDANVA